MVETLLIDAELGSHNLEELQEVRELDLSRMGSSAQISDGDIDPCLLKFGQNVEALEVSLDFDALQSLSVADLTVTTQSLEDLSKLADCVVLVVEESNDRADVHLFVSLGR